MRYKFDNTQHLHTLDGVALLGTSTAVSIIDKSGPMKYWAAGQAVGYLGWTPAKQNGAYLRMEDRITSDFLARHAELVNLTPARYLTELDNAYHAHSRNLDKAADKGTSLHAELEHYVKFCIDNLGGYPEGVTEPGPVKLFADWAKDNVKRFIASEAHCYSERLKTGGIVDLVFEDMDGNLVILDFKSSGAAYNTHFFQAAGYAIAIEMNGIFTADGEFVRHVSKPFAYYLTLPFGMKNPSPQIGTAKEKELGRDTTKCKQAFEYCVGLYRLVNGG